MPRNKPKAHELTTEQIARKMFPKKVREAVTAESQKASKPAEKEPKK